MITKCKFDKQKDFQETIPDLAISIAMALSTGVIKDTADSTPYSKMTSTEEVGNYLHDPIDIAMASSRLNAQLASSPMADVSTNGNPE
jgi:hypothetical protein